MRTNPFSPSFGTAPPVLAGRDHILEEVDAALDVGPSHPSYTLLLTGARGTGKTALLNALEELARNRGWVTISETSSPGLLQRLERAALRLLQESRGGWLRQMFDRIRVRLNRIWIFGLDPPPPSDLQGLREAITALSVILDKRRLGILITIDELQSGDPAELRVFAGTLQHVTRREGRPVAFVGAALPQIEDNLLADDAVTFLQRAARREVGRLDEAASRTAVGQPIHDRNSSIAPEGLEAAVRAASGYPFMIQLVGYHSWKAAAHPMIGITMEDVTTGIAKAGREIGRLVLAPTWKDLSDMDRRFLEAMSRDEGESALSDIAVRLERDPRYASVYRSRLIKAGMIIATGRGKIDFAHHAARGWIRGKFL